MLLTPPHMHNHQPLERLEGGKPTSSPNVWLVLICSEKNTPGWWLS
jgi:hypothetical protein